jgi:REP element-mobilizing transposase RayT
MHDKKIKKYKIESARLKEWDYSKPWWYYITINTKDHKHYFGRIESYKMMLNDLGKIAETCWENIINHYPMVELDYYVIMPNHLHGIIILNPKVETGHPSRLGLAEADAPSLQQNNIKQNNSSANTPSLSNIIGSFKSAVTKQIHQTGYLNFKWQRSFYDRIIRNETELFNIRKNIEQNPLKWDLENEIENLYQ